MKISKIVAVFTLLISSINLSMNDVNAASIITDAGLKACINSVVGQSETSDITDANINYINQNVGTLNCSNRNITDLTGISKLTNLTTLRLGNNSIADISELSNMTNLKVLDLSKNQIADISSLVKLTSITELTLNNNQITSLNGVEGMSKLESLNVKDNQISSISELNNFTNLLSLNIENNNVSDISVISTFGKIVTLTLNGNEISDISSLKNLNTLKNLYLIENKLTDESLSILNTNTLTSLESLSLDRNELTNLDSISTITTIKTLNVNQTGLTNIDGLSTLVNIRLLMLANNEISDITAVGNLASATSIDLKNNNIEELNPLSGLRSVNTLILNGNEISDVSPLASITSLYILLLMENHISDLSSLKDTSILSLNATNQVVFLPDLVIDVDEYKLEEIVIHKDGSVVSYTDNPIYKFTDGETKTFEVAWDNAGTTRGFSGVVKQNVTYNAPLPPEPTLTAEDFTIIAGTTLTDDGIISLSKAKGLDGNNVNIDGNIVVLDRSKLNTDALGVYEVTLQVTDSYGQKVVTTINVTVEAPAAPTLTAEDFTVQVGTNLSDKDIILLSKAKGLDGNNVSIDGNIVVLDRSKLNTNVAGVYPVTLQVTDMYGQTTEITINITVTAKPLPKTGGVNTSASLFVLSLALIGLKKKYKKTAV